MQEQRHVEVDADAAATAGRSVTIGDSVHESGSLSAELLARLQTTLDVGQLIRIFDASVQPVVPHASISYGNLIQDIALEAGVHERHSCTYRLAIGGEALGHLTLTRTTPFLREEAELFENLLVTLAFPLRNALMYQRALQSALMDPLTGLYNRTAMDSALRREILLARRNKTQLSLMILDIDHFKDINDRYGHAAGDTVIKTLSDRLMDCTRKSDILSRFGGEEYSVLMSSTDQYGACLLAERICLAVRSVPCQTSGGSIGFTVSIGVAMLRANESEQHFFERADAALYEAKHSGRDRVCFAP
ncbi:MAG: GGDEF domain-containing protein [Acidiferrobacterales bacterium]